jgi:hypothetical protein
VSLASGNPGSSHDRSRDHYSYLEQQFNVEPSKLLEFETSTPKEFETSTPKEFETSTLKEFETSTLKEFETVAQVVT